MRPKMLPFLFMLPFSMLALVAFFDHFLLAQAADVTLSDGLLALFGDIQSKAVAAVILMHVFQILKTHEVLGVLGKVGLSGRALQIAIAAITALGFCADAYAKGSSILQALIEGLFTAGGAMLVYQAWNEPAPGTILPLVK